MFSIKAKGWYSHNAAHSCKDIRDSGDSKGDGAYWIDLENNGNPLKVYCDMTTDGGEMQMKQESRKKYEQFIKLVPSHMANFSTQQGILLTKPTGLLSCQLGSLIMLFSFALFVPSSGFFGPKKCYRKCAN